jgi:hypothetical protein
MKRFAALLGAPLLALACLMVSAAPAPAQDRAPVILTPDTEVVLRFDDRDDHLVSADRAPAAWTAFEIAVARLMVAGTGMDSGSSATLRSHDNMPPAPVIERGVVRIRFFQIAGRHSVLFVENGSNRALVYRATMTRDGGQSPTDVCLVPAHQRGNEHWPHPIERFALSDFRLVEWQGGATVPCA